MSEVKHEVAGNQMQSKQKICLPWRRRGKGESMPLRSVKETML